MDDAPAGYRDPSGRHGAVTLTARPEPIAFDADATALSVVDMQNAYATVAALLDEVVTVPGTGGVLLVFDDFLKGLDDFGTKIQPLMASRRHVTGEALAEVA